MLDFEVDHPSELALFLQHEGACLEYGEVPGQVDSRIGTT